VIGLVLGFLIAAVIAICIFVSHANNQGSDAALYKTLTAEQAAELGDNSLSAIAEKSSSYSENPWSGASRRARNDMLVSVPGCGGDFVRAAAKGDTVQLRYIARSNDNEIVTESTRNRSIVDVVVGAGQVDVGLDNALVGVCTGEVLRLSTGRMIVFVAHVSSQPPRFGNDEKNSEEDDDAGDRVARGLSAITGGRGASCTSTCTNAGLTCNALGFTVVNTCPRLRVAFDCTICEAAAVGTAGPDMPCYVMPSAPAGHPRGFCMVHPGSGSKGSECDARYKHTRRLCPCVAAARDI
jgi:hypothetical protein